MKAKVIQGFFSHKEQKIIEKYTSIDVDDKRGQELIALGLIEEVKTKKQPAKKETEKETK